VTMELPPDVKSAVHANRKIEAIKLLRTQRNLGLKEAKGIVDAYVDENRHLIVNQRSGRDSGIGRILIIAIVGCVIYAAYRVFA
jgi:hypothetical protein